MTLAPHAAAVRGDDYHFIIGWYWACKALSLSDIESVSLEDKGSGNFDDLVVRENNTINYTQIKSSNKASTVISEDWLTTSSSKTGKSPLQHFYSNWKLLHEREPEKKLNFSIVTNRGVDHQDPILGQKDNNTNLVTGRVFATATPRSKLGQAKKRWSNHLGVNLDELSKFLGELEIRTTDGELDWNERAIEVMQNAGLRTDYDALSRGKEIVRSWVKNGMGPQSKNNIRKQVTDAQLLGKGSVVSLVINAIDRPERNYVPNVLLDWVDLYKGDSDFSRRELVNSSDWEATILPNLRKAVKTIEGYGSKKVYISGAMRLPIWFSLGVLLPSVRNWILTLDQRGIEWKTNVTPIPIEAISMSSDINQGDELAVEIALTHNSTSDVIGYIREKGLPVKELLTISVESGASLQSIESNEHALGWAESARNKIIDNVKNTRPTKLHLFIAAPAGAVAFLGYYWNMFPATTVYEHLGIGQGYAPTFTLK